MPSDLRILALTVVPPTTRNRRGTVLRPIRTNDREALAGLYRASYPPEVGAADLDAALAEIDLTFAGEFGDLRFDASFLACLNGIPVGAVLVVSHSIWDKGLSGPFVIDLFVEPKHRGLGVGSALMSGAISACRAHADRSLSLRVGEGTSPAAHSLYSKLGFTTP